MCYHLPNPSSLGSFDPRNSIYRALRDTEEATKRSTNKLQQPQTVVYAQHLCENYYIGKVQIPSLLLCNLEIKVICMARLSFMLGNNKLLETYSCLLQLSLHAFLGQYLKKYA